MGTCFSRFFGEEGTQETEPLIKRSQIATASEVNLKLSDTATSMIDKLKSGAHLMHAQQAGDMLVNIEPTALQDKLSSLKEKATANLHLLLVCKSPNKTATIACISNFENLDNILNMINQLGLQEKMKIDIYTFDDNHLARFTRLMSNFMARKTIDGTHLDTIMSASTPSATRR